LARVVAVCTSQKKGTKKTDIGRALLKENYGIEKDGHADSGSHRQVSLLSQSSIDKMKKLGLDVKPGDFAENITVSGMDVFKLPLNSLISIGEEVVLEITQIGKECHDRCAIFKQVGTCIMPVEGVFTRVIKGGFVNRDDVVVRI